MGAAARKGNQHSTQAPLTDRLWGTQARLRVAFAFQDEGGTSAESQCLRALIPLLSQERPHEGAMTGLISHIRKWAPEGKRTFPRSQSDRAGTQAWPFPRLSSLHMHPIFLGRYAPHPKLPTELHDRGGRSGGLMAFSGNSAATHRQEPQHGSCGVSLKVQLYLNLCVTITANSNDNVHLSSAHLLRAKLCSTCFACLLTSSSQQP